MFLLQLGLLAGDIGGLAPHDAGEAAVGDAAHDAADAEHGEAGELHQDVPLHARDLVDHQAEDDRRRGEGDRHAPTGVDQARCQCQDARDAGERRLGAGAAAFVES